MKSYRLNVCVPQNLYVEALTYSVVVFRDGASQEGTK